MRQEKMALGVQKEFNASAPGVEIYSDSVTPSDVMADYTSHYLVNNDPVVSKTYNNFRDSLTSAQKEKFKEQYTWAQQKEGEGRPFDEWLTVTGLPAAFRGYAFGQWPKDFNEKYYTREQTQGFDEMMKYLRSERVDK